MKMNTLTDLYVEQLKDLYSEEKQLVQALPKMAKAATTEELRKAFSAHLEQTKTHVSRLDEIFTLLETSSGNTKCEAMEGLIKEGGKAIEIQGNAVVRDAALIAAAQRVEHYEIAGYGTVRSYADQLGFKAHRKLLQETLDEEGKTDKQLTAIAEGGLLAGEGINDKAEAVQNGATARK